MPDKPARATHGAAVRTETLRIAGARVAWIVYTLWVLPAASVVLAFLPQTKRWLQG